MEIVGALSLIVGAALYSLSFFIASRANRGVRLPWWSNPPRNLGRSVAARAFGAGLIVWGSLTIPPFLGFVTAGLIVAVIMFAPMIGVIGAHNRRVASQDQGFASSART